MVHNSFFHFVLWWKHLIRNKAVQPFLWYKNFMMCLPYHSSFCSKISHLTLLLVQEFPTLLISFAATDYFLFILLNLIRNKVHQVCNTKILSNLIRSVGRQCLFNEQPFLSINRWYWAVSSDNTDPISYVYYKLWFHF